MSRKVSKMAGRLYEIVPGTEALDAIAPADPDNLQNLGDGVYEAKWGDIEQGRAEIESMCSQPDRITLIGEPYEPAHLPGWIAVRFSVVYLSSNKSDLIQ